MYKIINEYELATSNYILNIFWVNFWGPKKCRKMNLIWGHFIAIYYAICTYLGGNHFKLSPSDNVSMFVLLQSNFLMIPPKFIYTWLHPDVNLFYFFPSIPSLSFEKMFSIILFDNYCIQFCVLIVNNKHLAHIYQLRWISFCHFEYHLVSFYGYFWRCIIQC